jgi:uncharacterized protein YbaP (TraB family)
MTLPRIVLAAWALALLALAGCDRAPATSVPPAPPAASAAAAPPLWRVRDADSVVWLFGTMHALPQDKVWRTPAVDAAWRGADRIWFEVDVDSAEGRALAQRLATEGGYYPEDEPGLLPRLPEATRQALETRAAALRMPIQGFERMRPWFAGLVISMQFVQAAGFDPEAGVDQVLAREARAAGRDVRYLETIEQQIAVFANVPEDDQLRELELTLDDLAKGPQALRDIGLAWAEGDIEAIAEGMVEDLRVRAPRAYDALLTRRNARWTDQIVTMLAGSGEDFVAGGAAHFAGPDSVVVMLEARGLTVERVPTGITPSR